MAHKTADGKNKSSKFRAARYDKEHAEDGKEKEGERAQANRMEAKPQGNPEEKMGGADDEQAEEQVQPGIHEEIKGVVAQHGPAHTVNTTHDHDGMKSHSHSVHMDGYEHHAEHDGDEHVKHAHEHHGHASGMPMPEENEGNYPQGNEPPSGDGEESYGEPL